jgi:hypothetical protein
MQQINLEGIWTEISEDSPLYPQILIALENGAETRELEEIEPTPQPSWAEFRQNAIASRTWIRISSHNLRSLKLATSIEDCLWRVEERPELMSQVSDLWQLLSQESQPSDVELAELLLIAQQCNLPEEFKNLLQGTN